MRSPATTRRRAVRSTYSLAHDLPCSARLRSARRSLESRRCSGPAATTACSRRPSCATARCCSRWPAASTSHASARARPGPLLDDAGIESLSWGSLDMAAYACKLAGNREGAKRLLEMKWRVYPVEDGKTHRLAMDAAGNLADLLLRRGTVGRGRGDPRQVPRRPAADLPIAWRRASPRTAAGPMRRSPSRSGSWRVGNDRPTQPSRRCVARPRRGAARGRAQRRGGCVRRPARSVCTSRKGISPRSSSRERGTRPHWSGEIARRCYARDGSGVRRIVRSVRADLPGVRRREPRRLRSLRLLHGRARRAALGAPAAGDARVLRPRALDGTRGAGRPRAAGGTDAPLLRRDARRAGAARWVGGEVHRRCGGRCVRRAGGQRGRRAPGVPRGARDAGAAVAARTGARAAVRCGGSGADRDQQR